MQDKTLTFNLGWAHLARYVAQVPDPRAARGRTHSLFAAVTLACAAMLAGRNTITSIERWAAEAPPEVLAAEACRRFECVYGVGMRTPRCAS